MALTIMINESVPEAGLAIGALPTLAPTNSAMTKYCRPLSCASIQLNGVVSNDPMTGRLIYWSASHKLWFFHGDVAISADPTIDDGRFSHVYKDLLGIETYYAFLRTSGDGDVELSLDGSRL